MSDYAIKVEGLGKKYRIGNHAPYARFTELLIGAAKAPFNIAKQKLAAANKTANHPAARPSEFWALQDVNFTIKPGEIVGVIGRNGAGKSTLLKLLSRITEPTTGRIRYKGRVGSLLEVGTGFHPELTGRDNIFLNGAILGMTRAEVRRKFDEIVAFSEVEKFLDTAVKHYSSGMYMRLAFAVAAHLEPEILLIDEVLAVGDAEFQKKCLGKMGDVAKDGRTILFVSHNMAAITNLCTTGILLEKGRVTAVDNVSNVVQSYMQRQDIHVSLSDRVDRKGTGLVTVKALHLHNMAGDPNIRSGDHVRFEIEYEINDGLPHQLQFILGIYDSYDVSLGRLDSTIAPEPMQTRSGKGTMTCVAGPFNFTPGPLYINLAVLCGGDIADYITHAVTLNIEASDFYASGRTFKREETLYLLEQEWAHQSS